MASDEDFSAFVESRWGRLVRSAVLLGCSSSEAEDIVQSALVRCLVHWPKVRDADDPDAYGRAGPGCHVVDWPGRWRGSCQHLSIARVAQGLGVAWNTANDAVVAEGRRVLINDPGEVLGRIGVGCPTRDSDAQTQPEARSYVAVRSGLLRVPAQIGQRRTR